MACRGIDRLGMARGRTVAAAVVRCAKMRAALDDFSRNFDLRQTRIVACSLWAATRVFRNAARLRRVGLVLGRPPICGPLPDVADHVVKAVTVWWKCHDRRGALETIFAAILVREIALPGIGHMFAAGRKRVAPSIFGTV